MAEHHVGRRGHIVLAVFQFMGRRGAVGFHAPGGIFFGAMHDFGALFASIRHKGQTLATVIAHNIDDTAKKLFCIFAYLTLILVVAAFASIVASTFGRL